MAKNLVIWLVIAVVLMSVFQKFNQNNTEVQQVNYSSFLSQVDRGQIRKVSIEGRKMNVQRKDTNGYTTYIPLNDPKLLDSLLSKHITIAGEQPRKPSLLISIFISWFPMLLLIGIWVFFMRQMQGGGGGRGAMSFGKSKAKILKEDQIKITFSVKTKCF